MPRRKSDDIFKKLNKQTPLVKRKDISPLSSTDFTPKKSKTVKTSKVGVFSASNAKARRKLQSKQAAQLASRYHDAKNRPARQVPELGEDARGAKPKKTAAAVRKVQPAAPKVQPKPQTRQTQDLALGAPRKKQPKPQTKQTEDLMFSAPKAQKPSKLSAIKRTQSQSVPALKNKEVTFRHEIKYYINYRDYVVLSNALKAVMTLDPNAGDDKMYHIRSLYFDDMYETALHQKMNGTDDRYKYRIRIYNYSDATIKFEKKIKKGQFITKKSMLITRDEYERIIMGDIDFLLERDERLAREIYLEMKNKRLRPKVIVDYMREAYVSPFEDVRITFDKQLKRGLCVTDIFDTNTPSMPMFDKGMMVLEVKFNRFLPEYIKGVLQNINAANKSAISKYVICRRFD